MLIQWKLLSLLLFTISLVGVSSFAQVCNDFDVNLVDDNVKRSVETISGCVELCDDNEYLGLCNPLWDEEEATVVCQQLGYYRALEFGECSLSGSGLGTGVPFPHGIDCTGTETNLTDCSTIANITTCEYTAVTCTRSVEFQLTRRLYSVCEFEEEVEVCVEIVAGVTVEDVVIGLVSYYETATPDLDYEELDELLTFPANSTEGDELCVTITIINDNLVEHEEYFAISATGIGGLTQDAIFLLWHDYAEVDIVDDDLVEIGFGNATYTVVEGHGHVYACVEITNMEGEELERDIPFLLVSSDGSATDGEDFTSATQLLALHIGSSEGTQQCGGFDITDDAIQEMQETFTVSLTVADLAVQISSGGDRTTILITDDDEFQITFSEGTPYVSGGTVEVNFTGNFEIATAHCTLSLHPNLANLWVNCSEGHAVFQIDQVRGRRRYPIYVNATSTDGQFAYLDREVRRENAFCSAHLINEGVTVDGLEVTVQWQGTGPSTTGNETLRASVFECGFPLLRPPTQEPCTSPYTFTASAGGEGLMTIQADDTLGLCTFHRNVILQVPYEAIGY